MVQLTSRKQGWVPPIRPEWVKRINEEGACLNLQAVVPLNADELLQTAQRNTGLSHFGDDDWREPFHRYLDSLEKDAELNLMGRLMTRSDILNILEARLRIEDAYRRHPEIEDEQIERPLWVFGMGRSGTSILQTLLGLDAENRMPFQHEVMFPVKPESEQERQALLALADERATQWKRVTPEIESMHEFHGMGIAEVVMFEGLSFRCPAWLNVFGMAMSYTAWMAEQDYEKSFAYAKRAFKLLQWRSPKRRWVFKSPDSIHHLPLVLKQFPDARLVWAHRDPVRTMSSAVSLIATLGWIRSDRRLADEAYEGITSPPVVAGALNRGIDWIEQGIIPQSQLSNVQYVELVEDPAQAIREIYQQFGLSMSDAFEHAIQQYVCDNPREARPRHSYSLGRENEIAAERAAFTRYQGYFRVSNEV